MLKEPTAKGKCFLALAARSAQRKVLKEPTAKRKCFLALAARSAQRRVLSAKSLEFWVLFQTYSIAKTSRLQTTA